MRKLILPIALLVIVGMPAGAQSRWYRIVEDSGLSVDADTTQIVEIDSTVTETWVRWRWKTKNQKFGKINYSEKLDKLQFNCDPQRFRTMRSVYYNRAGEAVSSYDEPLDWEGTIPDSMGEELVTNLCIERGWLRWIRSRPRDTAKKGRAP